MSEALTGSERFLIDNSVYARATHPQIAPIWKEGLERDRLVACGPFVMEALYSARTADELEGVLEELTEGLDYIGLDQETWRLAFRAQARMSRVEPLFDRKPPIDYLVAAAAHQYGLGVLHYDADYDDISMHSGLQFESRWVAPVGSLTTAANPLRPLRRGIQERMNRLSGTSAASAFREIIELLDERIERETA